MFHFLERSSRNVPYIKSRHVSARRISRLNRMKKTACMAILLLVSVSMICGIVAAAEEPISPGPAPNSGDCIPDGSGFDEPNWQNEDRSGIGPAPNAGDGISDGSGF
jgi:hypothetical protein